MKKIVFLLLALTLLAGCNKETESTSDLAPVGGVISLRTQSELKDNSMTGVTQKLSVTSGITSEFPTPTSTSNVSLNLKLDPSMQFDTQTSSTTCDVRFIIEISGQDENGDRGRLLEKKVQSYKPASNGQYPINLELADGKYYITVWMDYVDENSVEDKYYETNSLSSISVNTPYVGNDDFKEVYVAQQVIEVSGAATLDMTLKQPMGKFEFITTDIEKFLGPQEYSRDKYQGNEYAGVVTGLAWTAVGGEILFVETSLSRGKGQLTLTGNLGSVMKESAMLALEYLKAHSHLLDLPEGIFDNWNIHIHVPEGAIPKDGPSAGITMVTSLASALTQRKVKANLAMTGEITLRGRVLPVGGIREKILAAKRAGIKDIILCEENRKDINEIQPMYLTGMTFHYVKDIKEVLRLALTDEKVADAIDFTVKEDKDKNQENPAQ